MEVITTIAALRDRLGPERRAGRRIGFVPTMGALHEGHMALAARARATCDMVVASIFVNPLQFAPSEDFSRYPRDLARDSALLERQGCDIVFAPAVEEMYPRPMATVVEVTALSDMLEGERRPGHFRGVATVVAKLFAIVQPDAAFFGEKDYQQLLVVRRMVEDLALPVEIVGVPTVRDRDGVALSSRNVYLTAEQRAAAPVLAEALAAVERAVAEGVTEAGALERIVRERLAEEPLGAPDLVAVRDAATLAPLDPDRPAAALVVLLAVRFGATRLIDQRVVALPNAARKDLVA